jgi:hypothetical protein
MRPYNVYKIIVAACVWVALALMVALCGCSNVLQSSLTQQHTSSEKDSTHTAVRLRIDTVIVPGDSVYIDVPVPVKCPNNDVPIFFDQEVQTDGQRNTVKLKFKAGKVVVDSRCKELELQVYLLDSVSKQYKSKADSFVSVRQEVKQVRYIPGAYKWAMGFTVSFFILLILFIAYKIFKLTPYGKVIPF